MPNEEYVLLQGSALIYTSEDAYDWLTEQDIEVIKGFPPYSKLFLVELGGKQTRNV